MTLTEQLCSARQAYHALQTGQSPRVVVDQNGERVEFTSINSDKLKSYIATLESQLAQVQGGFRVGRGPMNPVF